MEYTGMPLDGSGSLFLQSQNPLPFLLQVQHDSLQRQQIPVELHVLLDDLLQHLHEST